MKRKVQLYIADNLVDLSDDSWILFNWTREDLTNPTAVVNSSSHQIQLPGTCRNNSLFGSVFRLDRRTLFGIRYDGTDFDPMRKTPFTLYDDSGAILEAGYCRLDAVDTHDRKHAYTVSLFGGLGSFFYALASSEDGTPRTLASLVWTGDNGDDNPSFNIVPGAAAVADAWGFLETGTSALGLYHAWNIINFAPAYNGLPDDFDASHALMSDDAYFNIPAGVDEDDVRGYEYTYKAGCDSALVTFTNPHNEWELSDLRWYLQRPVVSVKAFITAICKPANNGGYTVTLDNTFFNDENPYYAAAWWTLPMIPSEYRTSAAALSYVMASTQTPMAYLVDYCKHYGLTFLYDSATRAVSIVTRATFYSSGQNILDFSARIDRSQQITQDPCLADKQWYQLGDGGTGQFADQYKSDYGVGYGVQRIDTGYEFDAGTTVLTDGQVFKDAAEVAETNRMFSAAEVLESGRYWRRYFQLPRFESVSIELWSDAGESKTFPVTCAADTTYYDNPSYPFTDWLPKLQLHGEDDKAEDGADVLVFFAGMKSTPTYSSGSWNVSKSYYITEDSDVMTALAGGPCWDLTRTGVQMLALPSFRRVVLSGKYITQSFEWGVPSVRPVPGIEYPTGAPTTLYAQWWESYLKDRYNSDTRVLTCRADLRGMDVGQSLLRRFYWFDNALWTMNAIRNYSMTTHDLAECEFIRVQDKTAYTVGPGSVRSHYLDITPYALSYSFHPGGEALTLTVDSSSAWTLTSSASPDWLTISAASGAAGTTTVIIALTANNSGGRRNVSVTMTNDDGDTVTFSLMQAIKADGGIGLSPAYIEIPASGTAIAGQASRGRTSGVTASGAWAVDMSTVPDWLSISTSLIGISLRAGSNSGSERSANIKVYLTGDTTTYATLAVVQLAGEGGTGDILLLDGNGNDSATMDASGGTLSLYVTLPDGDDWTIANNTSFASVSPVSGSDNTTLTVTVPSYSGTTSRQGTIVATRSGYSEGAVFYLIQNAAAASTSYIYITRRENFMENNVNVGNGVEYEGFDITATGAWTVTTSASWVHVYGNAWSGTGSAGPFWFKTDANTGAARTAILTATLTATGDEDYFYIYQAGDGTVTLSASFNKTTIDSTAQTLYLTVQTQSGIAWSIRNVSSALSPDVLSGTGPAEIDVDVTAWSGASYRTLSLEVYNTTYGLSDTASVRQNAPAASDYLNVVPFGTINVSADTTSQQFSIECSTSWQVSADRLTVTFDQSSGSGNVIITATFNPNTGTGTKETNFTFTTTAGTSITKTVQLIQASPSTDSITASTDTVTLAGAGTSTTVSVTSSGAWTASKSDSWITVTSSGSAGTSTATISAGRNAGTPRTGTVTFTCGSASATVAVVQGSDADLEVSANAVELASTSGATGSVIVYASDTWDISEYSDNPVWLGISMSTHAGSDNGETLTFEALSANTDGTSRTANIRVVLANNSSVYQDIVVSQRGQSTLYVSPASVYVSAYQGSGTLTLTSNTDWSITAKSPEVHIADEKQSGTGDDVIPWYVEGNPSVATRALYITFETDNGEKIATVNINQAGGMLYFDPTSLVLAGNGETAEVDCVSSDAWTLDDTTVPAWLTVTPAGSSQTGTVMTFVAVENSGTSDRTATVYVENQYNVREGLPITQRGRSSYSLTVSPSSVYLEDATASSGTINITSDTSWVIEVDTSSSNGLTVSTASGTGNAAVTWDVPANVWDVYLHHIVKVKTADGSILRTVDVYQPPVSGQIISVTPNTDSLTFYADAPESTKTFTIKVLALENWTAYANGYAPWCVFDNNAGTANVAQTITFTPTISASDVQTVEFVIEATGGYTRTITITTLPSSD